MTTTCLAFLAAAGLAYVSSVASGVFADPATVGFPREDLFVYSAKWWSYLVPPVEHPLLGATAARIWNGAGVRTGLLEQQSVRWAIIALAIAIFWWLVRERPGPRARVPVLVIVAVAASSVRCHRAAVGPSRLRDLLDSSTTARRCSVRTRGLVSSCN
jgi:hypothetical protein